MTEKGTNILLQFHFLPENTQNRLNQWRTNGNTAMDREKGKIHFEPSNGNTKLLSVKKAGIFIHQGVMRVTRKTA